MPVWRNLVLGSWSLKVGPAIIRVGAPIPSQNQLPTVNENLGRAPTFVSNQGNFESAGLPGRGFEAPQAQLGNFGVERGEPGFESSLAHQRSPQGAYRRFESPDAHLGAQGSQGGLQGVDTAQVHRMAP